MLSRIPERLNALNKGLRTLHFYQLDYSPFDPTTIVGGTQDNGSWERGDTAGSGTNGTGQPASYDPAQLPDPNDCLSKGRPTTATAAAAASRCG